jgi:hypothetical protein
MISPRETDVASWLAGSSEYERTARRISVAESCCGR